MTPAARKKIAGWLVIVSLIAWPTTQFLFARDEPAFTLALSWFAITLTALDIWATTDVRAKDEE